MSNHPRTVVIDGSPITLLWSEWYRWDTLKQRINPPGATPQGSGVYEVAPTDARRSCAKRVYIGCTRGGGKLWARVTKLVDESGEHSAGKRIRAAIHAGNEQETDLWVRWAETKEYTKVEKCLFMRYIKIHRVGPHYCWALHIDYDLRFDFPDDLADSECSAP